MVLKQRKAGKLTRKSFENDVKMYGTETPTKASIERLSLRMM